MNALRKKIVLACHILIHQRLDSGPFGNVSMRIPGSDKFWVNPQGVTFNELGADQIVCVDIEGNILEGKHEPHPGTFIHREIYRLRNDVNAIVHTHSLNTVTLSLLGCEIEPYTQLGAAIFGDQGLYQGFSGPVRDSNEGSAIAQALGQKSIVIAKNHGLFTAKATMEGALWDMIVADQAAQIHLAAKLHGLSKAEILNPECIQKSKIEVRDKQCDFMWNSLIRQPPFKLI